MIHRQPRRIATITIPDINWNGSELITFTATDPNLLANSDAAAFTVTAINDAPIVADIPDQTVAEGVSFATINLDSYVADVDNLASEISWTYSGNIRSDGGHRSSTGWPLISHPGHQLERL